MAKPKVVVKKSRHTKKGKMVTKIAVHNPDPVVEIIVHDPTMLERIVEWVKQNFA